MELEKGKGRKGSGLVKVVRVRLADGVALQVEDDAVRLDGDGGKEAERVRLVGVVARAQERRLRVARCVSSGLPDASVANAVGGVKYNVLGQHVQAGLGDAHRPVLEVVLVAQHDLPRVVLAVEAVELLL